MSAVAQRVQQTGGAHQDGAVAAQQEIGDALFAGFEDARAGDARREIGGADALERRAETVEIEIVERDAGGAEVDGGFELRGGADQQMEGGGLAALAGCIVCWRKRTGGTTAGRA